MQEAQGAGAAGPVIRVRAGDVRSMTAGCRLGGEPGAWQVAREEETMRDRCSGNTNTVSEEYGALRGPVRCGTADSKGGPQLESVAREC